MSDSSIGCSVAPGVGTDNLVVMTVLSSTSSFLEEYLQKYAEENKETDGAGKVEYQPPMVLNVTPANAPTVKRDFKIQIDGQSFGVYDSTPGAALVGSACSSITWTSDSALTCAVSHGLGSPACSDFETEEACYAAECGREDAFTNPMCRVVSVEVGGQRGSLVGQFSFDGPEVDLLVPANAPATGAINVTLFGANFGMHAAYGHKAVAGVRPCTSSLWYSDSSISCEVAPFTGKGYRMGLYALFDDAAKDYKLKSVQIRSPMLSYDKPHIIAFEPATSPAVADVVITAIGANFGAAECGGDCKEFAELELKLGDTICHNTAWTSDSSIACGLAPYPQRGTGVGRDLPPSVVVGKQLNDADNIRFSYRLPEIKGFTTGYIDKQNMKPYSLNGPAEGGHELTVFGSNFGALDYSAAVTIGDSACRAKAWVSDTSILCTTTKATIFLAGKNLELPLRVVVGLEHYPRSYQTGLMTEAYNYDPVIYRNFQITNTEINFLCYVGSFTAALIVIMVMNRYYARNWPRAPAALAIQRAKHPNAYVRYNRDFEPMFPQLPASTHALQKALRLRKDKYEKGHRWPTEKLRDGHRQHKLGTVDDDQELESESSSAPSSEGDGDFYDFEAGAAPRNRDRVLEEAFARGMQAGMSMAALSEEPRAELLHTKQFYLPTLRNKVDVKQAEGDESDEEENTGAAERKLANASICQLQQEIREMEAKLDARIEARATEKMQHQERNKGFKKKRAADTDSKWSKMDDLKLMKLMQDKDTRETFLDVESAPCRTLLLKHFGGSAKCEHGTNRSDCKHCFVFSQAQCLHRVQLFSRDVDMNMQYRKMTARMEEKGPGGVPHGWSLLSSHMGDIPESVAGPANVGAGGGGRKTHWELMERSRHEEHKKQKQKDLQLGSTGDLGAASGRPGDQGIAIERVPHGAGIHPGADRGARGFPGAVVVTDETIGTGTTDGSYGYGPASSGPDAAVLDAVVIEGLEEK